MSREKNLWVSQIPSFAPWEKILKMWRSSSIKDLWNSSPKVRLKWSSRTRYLGISISLHIILWLSIVVWSLGIRLLIEAALDPTLLPCQILLIITPIVSVIYVIFHSIISNRLERGVFEDIEAPLVNQPLYLGSRLLAASSLLWLITSGWNLIVAARQPICLPYGYLLQQWQSGSPCEYQRIGTGFSIILMITSCILFTLFTASQQGDPFEAHLLGYAGSNPSSSTLSKPANHLLQEKHMDPLHSYHISISSEKLDSTTSSPVSPTNMDVLMSPRTLSPISDAWIHPVAPIRPLNSYYSQIYAYEQPLSGGPSFAELSAVVAPPGSKASLLSSPRLAASSPSPGTYPGRPAIKHRYSTSSTSIHSRRPSLQSNSSAPPAPFAVVDSAWRAVHPPNCHFPHAPFSAMSRHSSLSGTRIYPSSLSSGPGSRQHVLRSSYSSSLLRFSLQADDQGFQASPVFANMTKESSTPSMDKRRGDSESTLSGSSGSSSSISLLRLILGEPKSGKETVQDVKGDDASSDDSKTDNEAGSEKAKTTRHKPSRSTDSGSSRRGSAAASEASALERGATRLSIVSESSSLTQIFECLPPYDAREMS